MALTLERGRRAFAHRRVVVCRELGEGMAALQAREPGRVATARVRPGGVGFLFPGQGSQSAGLGAGLYSADPVFRREIDRCSAILAPMLDTDIASLVSCGAPTPGLQQTALVQPVLFAIGYALARSLESAGVQPVAMLGHSVGELVAACVAGVFTLEDGLSIVAWRGRLMQGTAPGAMTAVSAAEDALGPYLGRDLEIAAYNGPGQCVVAGSVPAIVRLERGLGEAGLQSRRLEVAHAFHSSRMEPVLGPFAEVVGQIALSPPQIPFVSDVTGTWITAEQAVDPAYWASQIRRPVRFADGVAALRQRGLSCLLELGPGRTLGSLVRRSGAADDLPVWPTMGVPEDGALPLRLARGAVWAAGAADTPGNEGLGGQRIRLPGYPFERRRHWRAPVRPAPAPVAAPPPPGDDAEANVAAVFEQILGIQGVGPQDDFFARGGDSLVVAHLLQRLEGLAGAPVSLRAVLEAPTVEALARLVSAARAPAPLDSAGIDWVAAARVGLPIAPSGPRKRVLLTGATGYFGANLLAELLREDDTEVLALVRCTDPEEGGQRIAATLARFGLREGPLPRSVVILPGDLGSPRLGLSEAEFSLLARGIERIWHCGAWVNHLYPYSRLEAVNVGGTRQIARLAAEAEVIPIHHISTTAVLRAPPSDREGVWREDEPLRHPELLTSGYAQSKWVAERLLEEVRASGVPVTIYRVGNLFGDTQTGICNTGDFLFRILKSCLALGLAPREWTLDVLPVDYARRAVVGLSRTDPQGVFHIVNPEETRWETLLDAVLAKGYRLEVLPMDIWRARSAAQIGASPDDALFPLLPAYRTTGGTGGSRRYDCRATLAGLAGSGIACPRIDRAYLDKILEHLVTTSYLPPPTTS